ncbi:helix-turn-helix domain-containing protein [[Clostridium] scindens]|uniref:helix-turn-helix domain-containing protein n=1 Tax=Clostridium scindens (strain JCM 10418 / VPI 12708) TaxID=29347 RepID=UPI0039A12972
MTVREMRELLGLSRAAFSRIYKIPVRTLEDWEAGRRKCPDYVLYLLERCVKEDKKKRWFSAEDISRSADRGNESGKG